MLAALENKTSFFKQQNVMTWVEHVNFFSGNYLY